MEVLSSLQVIWRRQESKGTSYNIRGFKSNHKKGISYREISHLLEQPSHRHGRIPTTGGFKDVIGCSAR